MPQDQADPVNVIFKGSNISSDEVVNILVRHATNLGDWGNTYGFSLYYPISGLGQSQNRQLSSPPGIAGTFQRYHARLWNYSGDCVVGAAHHEYFFSLSGKSYGPIPLPILKLPHAPTDFESGKWAIEDSFGTERSWQVLRDDVALSPRQLTPAHNGRATKVVRT